MIKKTGTLLTVIAIFFSVLYFPALASESAQVKVDVLSTIKLTVPKDLAARNYLGIPGDAFFTIPQIKAEVVLIEIFSMYCPYCQREAPRVNELYSVVENDSNLKGKIKIIGIGAGNSPYEVEVFKKTYKVSFPLFPDEDFTIHKACGEVRTPYFIGVKITPNNSLVVFYSKAGGFQEPRQFLKEILKLSRL